ncbi:MAG: hypothetical protein ABSE48_21045, partial [Verrucomicrobiota bacterium]
STFINFQSMWLSKRLWATGGIAFLLLVALVITRHVLTWGHHVFLDLRLIFAAAVLTCLLVTGRNLATLCRILAKPFLRAGAISYALYVIHMPILFFIADLLRHSGMSLFWLPSAVLFILPLAWWLELEFQPWIARVLDITRTKLLMGNARIAGA